MELQFQPVALDAHFPILVDADFQQRDRPIRHLHFHDCAELGLCAQGTGVFMVGAKLLPFQAGDAVLIDRSEPHLAQSAPGTTSRWSWIYLDPVSLLNPSGDALRTNTAALAGPGFNNVLTPEAFPEAGWILKRILEEARACAADFEGVIRSLILQFLLLAHRYGSPSEGTGIGVARKLAGRPQYDRLAPALQRLAADFAEPLSTTELARLCHLSEPHFRRLFHEALGRSPRAYAFDLRMRMAASLLAGTSGSVLEISQRVGFETLSSFNRIFRKTYGVAPRDWRKGRES